jgi:uncharacterized protein (DUF1697 family)
MTRYIAFLRAVNVGGKNRLSMAELRNALTADGLEHVSTVLQSGNVLFHSAEPEHAAAATVGDTIEKAFGMHIGIVVRAAAELTAIADRNPFLATGKTLDPARLHVAFLSDRPAAAAVAMLDPDRSPPDAFVVDGREVYLSYPNGSGRTRLTLDYLERRLKVRGTARNWRTVERLAALLEV